ncbi:MAG: hypothetical protein FWE82_04130, partial [Defluviitaleaceae bacterium]|nr:hypothetical protein [Defluviitaleaceae bacterium]
MTRLLGKTLALLAVFTASTLLSAFGAGIFFYANEAKNSAEKSFHKIFLPDRGLILYEADYTHGENFLEAYHLYSRIAEKIYF